MNSRQAKSDKHSGKHVGDEAGGDTGKNADDTIVWRPGSEHLRRSHLRAFMESHHFDSLDRFQERSTSDVAWFTEAVLKYLDIKFQRNYSRVLDLSEGMEFPRWCVDGQLNIVYNCVDKWAQDPVGHKRMAVIYESEEGKSAALTYRQLHREVNRCVHALRHMDIRRGDVVALYMPMTPELIIALLAVAKIGAVSLPLFSGYGVNALVERLNDAGARCMFTADGFVRRGRPVMLKPIVDQALEQVPTVRHVVVHQRLEADVPMKTGRDHWWSRMVSRRPPNAGCAPTAAEDPLMILYTSGTTGRPKGVVHTHCGFPVKAAQDMAFGTDVHAGDAIFWMTDMGWMMGPWLVFGATLLGAACFIYDGAHDYPGPDRIWSMVARHKINVLGVSPTLVRSLIPHGEKPVKSHNISSIRCFGSTGEPWNPEAWMWLFREVGNEKIPIINYSGGTEISGGIVMGNPLTPLKPMAFSGPCPGMDADVVDEAGRSVRGRVGELVIRSPWIGMTRGFWKDRQRYLDTYWDRFKDIWVHGDWAMVDEDGMWYILGRSDDTIKVAGRRVGPAEIESVLADHPVVIEAAAIGVPDELKGSRLVCFCVLKAGAEPVEALKQDLLENVSRQLGKPLQPDEIHFIPDLPRTRNGKIMRRVIRAAYLGEDMGDISALQNPDSLEDIKQMH